MSEPPTPSTPLDAAPEFYRWSVMVAAGLMLFGTYFAYHSISAVSQLLIEQGGYTATQVGLMDSLYSWPNILGSALLAGVLIDKFGTRAMSLVLASLVVLGAVLVAVAPGFTVLLIGRAVLGVGAEGLVVCQSTILTKWFKKQQKLGIAFAMTLVFVRLASFASLNLESAVANKYGGVSAAFWFAVIMCVFSLVVAVCYVVMEKAVLAKARPEAWPSGESEPGAKGNKPAKNMHFAKILTFDSRFWYLVILCTVFYGGMLPFLSLAQDFFHDKWGIAAEAGARIISTVPIVSVVLALIIGKAFDKVGKRVTMLVCGTFLMIPAHLSLGLSNIHPLYPMILLGVSLALVSTVLWPTVSLIVEDEAIGTAHGLLVVVQNIGLAVFPVLNGTLRDSTHSYVSSQLMFAALGSLGFVFALLLLRADRQHAHVMQAPLAPVSSPNESRVGA